MPKPSTLRKTPLLRAVLDQPGEIALARDADVEVAVGDEDDAIDAAADEVACGLLVGELDPGATVGRSTCLQVVDRLRDHKLALAARRGSTRPLVPA
jgi:hypothetical protein